MNYDFPVIEKELLFEDRNPGLAPDWVTVPRRKAIINGETKEVISVVTDRYEVTTHKEVIDSFDKLDFLERESVSLTGDGGVMFAHYNFANRIKDKHILRIGDTVRFSLRVFNSYNLMTSRGFELFAHNLVCMNGMVIPRQTERCTYRHINTVSRDMFSDTLGTQGEKMASMVCLWNLWSEMHPDLAKVDSYLNKMELQDDTRERLADTMKSKRNLWEMYNVITYHTTHDLKTRGKNKLVNQRKKDIELTNEFYNHKWN